MTENWQQWLDWARSEVPFTTKLPGEYHEKLSNFDRLLLIKVLRLEMVQISIAEFIIKEMGSFYVESVSSAMDVVYKEISTTTPFIFVLTTGSDPMAILQKFAQDMGVLENLKQISLG